MIISVKKHLTGSSNQYKIDRFLAKFAQKIPTKSAVFIWLFSSKVSPQNVCKIGWLFRKSVSENPVKLDLFSTAYQKPCVILNHLIVIYLAPVVQKVDSAIHWINYYPVDSAISFHITYPLDSDLSGG